MTATDATRPTPGLAPAEPATRYPCDTIRALDGSDA